LKQWVFIIGFNNSLLIFSHNSWSLENPETTWLLWKHILQEIIDMTHCNTCKQDMCNQPGKLANNQARDEDRKEKNYNYNFFVKLRKPPEIFFEYCCVGMQKLNCKVIGFAVLRFACIS